MAKAADVVQIGSSPKTANRALGAAWESITNGYRAGWRSTTKAYDAVKQYTDKGYKSSREYMKSGADFAARVGNDVNELAKRQPVIAMVTIFAAGFAATYLVGRITTRKAPPARGWRSAWRR